MNPQGTNNSYPYPHYPNPNPNPNPSTTFASAPPFSHYPSYPPDPSPAPQSYAPHPNPPSDPYLPPAPIYPHNPKRPDLSAPRFDHTPKRPNLAAGRFDYTSGRPCYGSRRPVDGARGTKVSGSSAPAFDGYGRSISFSGSKKESGGGLGKVVKAVPKVEVDEDTKSGVSKFRVKLLAESAGQTTTDVVCQIGFNGILMLEPNTKRTLRIYPLGTITKWEINSGDPSICQFWSKSPVDIEPRRIRLQSNRYTASTILDVIAASTVQSLGYRGGRDKSIPLRAVHAYEDDSAHRRRHTQDDSFDDEDDSFDDEDDSDEVESDDGGRYELEPQEERRQQFRTGLGRHVSSSAEWVIRKGRGDRVMTGYSSSYLGDARVQKKRVGDDSWIVTDVIPGGPLDDSVIPSFGGHIARRIWEGNDRKVLKCLNRHRVCTTLQGWSSALSDITGVITDSGLCHLPYNMFPYLDMPLISAFVERWQPDTNSFHLPFGEMTIMLHDVFQILRIPVEGRMVSAQASISELKFFVLELLGVSLEDLVRDTSFWSGGGVSIDVVDDYCRRRRPPRTEDTQMTAYLFLLLGCVLFVDKSGCRVRSRDLLEARDPVTIGQYSWGSATLAFLYRQLGIASRADCSDIAGCLTLLQAWIYEYFPLFRPHPKPKIIESGYPRARLWVVRSEDRSEGRLHSIRRQLDKMTASQVEWLPYGPEPAAAVPRTLLMGVIRYRDITEPYLPDRVLRQLGYVQVIPVDIPTPKHAMRSANATTYDVRHSASSAESIWRTFPRGGRLYLGDLTRSRDPSTCHADYLQWFGRRSHPVLVRGTGPRLERPLNRTCGDAWMRKTIRVTQSFLRYRDQMPNEETRSACADLDDLIQAWSSQLGISDLHSDDEL